MDAARFDRMARVLFVANSRRSVVRALSGIVFGAASGFAWSDETVARKKCGPCRKKKKGKCKKKKPNGTSCPGGQCFNGACNASCCGAGCATRCAADEVCADPGDQRCAPACNEACEDRAGCNCNPFFDSSIEFCVVDPTDLPALCATPVCDSQADCATDAFCATVFCDSGFTSRCLEPCPA